MKILISIAVFVIGLLIENVMPENANATPTNTALLNKAKALVQEFEAQREAELLREAYLPLVEVDPAREPNASARAQVRNDCLSMWLFLVAALDRHLDPKFNPNDLPEIKVQPPPTSKGVMYPPGVDPDVIDDPKARADYERALAARQPKADQYRLQIRLRRLNEDIPERAEAFIRKNYSSDSLDQEVVRTAIDKIIKNPERKAKLLKSLQPPAPK